MFIYNERQHGREWNWRPPNTHIFGSFRLFLFQKLTVASPRCCLMFGFGTSVVDKELSKCKKLKCHLHLFCYVVENFTPLGKLVTDHNANVFIFSLQKASVSTWYCSLHCRWTITLKIQLNVRLHFNVHRISRQIIFSGDRDIYYTTQISY